MGFLSEIPDIIFKRPLFCGILANTLLSTVPGVSGAGATPEKTLLTPVLDAELITTGAITSHKARPDTPTGCPTPASITRAMMELCGIQPVFINAGLRHTPTVPCFDIYGKPGEDPRFRDAVPHVLDLVKKGEVSWQTSFKMQRFACFGRMCSRGNYNSVVCFKGTWLRGFRQQQFCQQSGDHKRTNLQGVTPTNQGR